MNSSLHENSSGAAISRHCAQTLFVFIVGSIKDSASDIVLVPGV